MFLLVIGERAWGGHSVFLVVTKLFKNRVSGFCYQCIQYYKYKYKFKLQIIIVIICDELEQRWKRVI